MFIRFAVGDDGQDHRQLTGLFTEARLLRDGGVLSDAESARLDELYSWFNEQLPVPPFGHARWPRFSVCWFKHDAGPTVGRMWELATLLDDHGQPVRLLRSRAPGRVHYEDAHQVVVTEWRRL